MGTIMSKFGIFCGIRCGVKVVVGVLQLIILTVTDYGVSTAWIQVINP